MGFETTDLCLQDYDVLIETWRNRCKEHSFVMWLPEHHRVEEYYKPGGPKNQL